MILEGAILVLKPVTKRFTDNSTLNRFEFTFYCDCCAKALPAISILPQPGFRKKIFLSRAEREARAIIYANDHSKAYERANNEARHELNRCEVCGELVCEECTVYDALENGGVCCKRCAPAAAKTVKNN